MSSADASNPAGVKERVLEPYRGSASLQASGRAAKDQALPAEFPRDHATPTFLVLPQRLKAASRAALPEAGKACSTLSALKRLLRRGDTGRKRTQPLN